MNKGQLNQHIELKRHKLDQIQCRCNKRKKVCRQTYSYDIFEEKPDKDRCDSGAPVAQRAAKWSPILIYERKGNPSMDFLKVIKVSGIARGCVCMTTTAMATTESRKMAAIFQLIG